MLSLSSKHGVIISRMPVFSAGIEGILARHFTEYELTYYSSIEAIALQKIQCASIVIVDLTGEQRYARRNCQQYYSLLSQCDNAHWIFFVSGSLYPVAEQLLLRPYTTLLSDEESIAEIVTTIQTSHEKTGKISQTLLMPAEDFPEENSAMGDALTFSERKVLRLLGKGWGINQIATLLKKSNKTISAQKNSAMRRLLLRSNADLYTWINSSRGMKELNLGTAFGERKEWEIIAQKET
ncbi:LuxR C-terminal-related transcriptional regulator [Kosakonia sp. ML.JS2a]|uniref:LuxR C-terminal-related transcriptional regulator n=1 Tax=Kosakonia sp. ML.JS2a TaxID=2980557 RepID=UPI0021D9E953|nr:LuxR C-terminal-related transcriptional regulator [Kosakonia sp. ML.JS2a]UXY10348.1 LuxR C-terminal-related transcriptional regulator [Kosakonia sp. ML.JS2a]